MEKADRTIVAVGGEKMSIYIYEAISERLKHMFPSLDKGFL